ncbi:MAG: SPW repeat protein, partial [Planctomycetes bacterium]|nr:SPW repeat protein [Planctomycetota bacterium]
MAATISTHRTQVQWASGLNLLVGVWLFVSAFAVYARGPMVTNNALCGIGVAALAAIRALGAYEQGWLSWANVLLGA